MRYLGNVQATVRYIYCGSFTFASFAVILALVDNIFFVFAITLCVVNLIEVTRNEVPKEELLSCLKLPVFLIVPFALSIMILLS